MSRGLFSVFAATATSASRIWFSEPYLRVVFDEEDAPRVGAYVEHGDRLCRVVRIERPEDWFETEVTVVMTNGPIEARRDSWDAEGKQFMTLLSRLPSTGFLQKTVNWLEDRFGG